MFRKISVKKCVISNLNRDYHKNWIQADLLDYFVKWTYIGDVGNKGAQGQ